MLEALLFASFPLPAVVLCAPGFDLKCLGVKALQDRKDLIFQSTAFAVFPGLGRLAGVRFMALEGQVA